MEQKMVQGTGLAARQKQLLDLAIKEPYILNTFYLSGGTALSYWYLHHRQSGDLDFFSTVPFDYDRITRWFRQLAKNLLKAREYTDYPRMLVPFDKYDMYTFYENLARKMKSKILK